MFVALALPQPNQAKRQQAAQLGAALDRGHRRWGDRVGTTDGTGIECHDQKVQDYAAVRDLGTGQPARDRHGWNRSTL